MKHAFLRVICSIFTRILAYLCKYVCESESNVDKLTKQARIDLDFYTAGKLEAKIDRTERQN